MTDGVRTSPDTTRDPEVQNLLRETSKHGFDSVEDLSILSKDELREAGTSLKDEQISPIHRKLRKIVKTRGFEEEDRKSYSYPSLRPKSQESLSPPPSPPSSSSYVPPVLKRDSKIKMRHSMCMSNTGYVNLIKDHSDKGEWAAHVAGYLSKCRSSILSDMKSPRKNATSGLGAWQRRFFELPSAPCRYLRYFKNRKKYERCVDNPKPDCTINLSKVRNVVMRDDHITIDLNFDDGGMYSIRAEDGGLSDASRWHTALSSRVRWLRDRNLKKDSKEVEEEKKIVLNVSSKEDEEEDEEEDENVVDPYVDSMTNAEREAVKELRHRLRDLIQSEALKRQRSKDSSDAVVVPGRVEEEEEEEEDSAATRRIETHFQEASEHMRTNKSLDLTNDQKGNVYGLYKQATKGKVTSSRPSMFDPVGRAKWDAWKKLESLSCEDAKEKYVSLVRSLSPLWKPSVIEKKKKKKKKEIAKTKTVKTPPKGKRPDEHVGILDIHNEYRLLKYIRAKSGNVKKAEAFVRRGIKYRQDFNVRDVLTPGMYTQHPILKHYGQGAHIPWGIDRDGAPIRFERVGRLDPKILKHVPDRLDFMLFEMWKAETMEMAMRNLSTPTHPQRGVVVVRS